MSRAVTSMQERRPSCPQRTRQPVAMATKPTPAEITTDADAMPEDHAHPQFEPSQKARDVLGRVHLVAEQIGCAVFVEGGGWLHPTKVFPVA